MNPAPASVTAVPPDPPRPSAQSRETESDDERRQRLQRFGRGLERPKEAQAAGPPPPGAAAVRSNVPSAQRKEGEDAAEAKADVEGEALAGDDDPAAGESEGTGVLDLLAHKLVEHSAKRVLRQRVLENASRVMDPDAGVRVPKPARGERKEGKDRAAPREDARGEALAAPSGSPSPLPPAAPPPAAAPPALRADHPVPPPMLRQMVEFAQVHRDRSGVIEFQIGMKRSVLGGATIVMRALGERRIGLRVQAGADDALTPADVDELVGVLRARGLEVVEVELR